MIIFTILDSGYSALGGPAHQPPGGAHLFGGARGAAQQGRPTGWSHPLEVCSFFYSPAFTSPLQQPFHHWPYQIWPFLYSFFPIFLLFFLFFPSFLCTKHVRTHAYQHKSTEFSLFQVQTVLSSKWSRRSNLPGLAAEEDPREDCTQKERKHAANFFLLSPVSSLLSWLSQKAAFWYRCYRFHFIKSAHFKP